MNFIKTLLSPLNKLASVNTQNCLSDTIFLLDIYKSCNIFEIAAKTSFQWDRIGLPSNSAFFIIQNFIVQG